MQLAEVESHSYILEALELSARIFDPFFNGLWTSGGLGLAALGALGIFAGYQSVQQFDEQLPVLQILLQRLQL